MPDPASVTRTTLSRSPRINAEFDPGAFYDVIDQVGERLDRQSPVTLYGEFLR
jgi:hypothetical protein